MRNVFLPSQRVPRVGVRACLSAFSRPASQGGLGHASQHFTPTLTVLSPSGGRTFAKLEGRDAASTWARHDTSEPLSPSPSSSERPTPIAIRQHHGKHWQGRVPQDRARGAATASERENDSSPPLVPRPQSRVASFDPRRSQSESSFECGISALLPRIRFSSSLRPLGQRLPGYQLPSRPHPYVSGPTLRVCYALIDSWVAARAVVATITEGLPIFYARSSENKRT